MTPQSAERPISMTDDELIACPFPHEAKHGVFLETDTVDFGFVRGACADCGAAGPYVTLDSCEKVTSAERGKATRLWNDRAAATLIKDLHQQVERQREALLLIECYSDSKYARDKARAALTEKHNG